jgi:lysophospholipase L1-like esterase
MKSGSADSAPTRHILCFGDSLTWGWIPADPPVPSTRFPLNDRWPGVLAETLGERYVVIEEGLSGRTTTADDAADPRLNGSTQLPFLLASHLPLDLVVLMLGTNDTKAAYERTPFEIAAGMSTLVAQVLSSAGGVGTTYPSPKVLVVAPPRIADIGDPWLSMTFAGGQEKTAQLAGFTSLGRTITTSP